MNSSKRKIYSDHWYCSYIIYISFVCFHNIFAHFPPPRFLSKFCPHFQLFFRFPSLPNVWCSSAFALSLPPLFRRSSVFAHFFVVVSAVFDEFGALQKCGRQILQQSEWKFLMNWHPIERTEWDVGNFRLFFTKFTIKLTNTIYKIPRHCLIVSKNKTKSHKIPITHS